MIEDHIWAELIWILDIFNKRIFFFLLSLLLIIFLLFLVFFGLFIHPKEEVILIIIIIIDTKADYIATARAPSPAPRA